VWQEKYQHGSKKEAASGIETGGNEEAFDETEGGGGFDLSTDTIRSPVDDRGVPGSRRVAIGISTDSRPAACAKNPERRSGN